MAEGSCAPGGIQLHQVDAAGNVSVKSTPYPSALTVDATPPSLIGITPPTDGGLLAPGGFISRTFGEAIQRGTGELTLSAGDGHSVRTLDIASIESLSIDGPTLSLAWFDDLSTATTYQLAWSEGAIADAAGNPVVDTESFSSLAFISRASFTGLANGALE